MAKNSNDIVLVSLARTASDKFTGPAKDVSSVEFAEAVKKELIRRPGLKPEQISEINLGFCVLAEASMQTDIPTRQALIRGARYGAAVICGRLAQGDAVIVEAEYN